MSEEKHPGGRPPKFNTPEELESIIEAYFASCKPEYVTDDNGNVMMTTKGVPLIRHNPYTITGLALALGFNSRGTIYEYEKKNDQFSDIIKNARLKCENYVEKGTLSGDIPPAPGIFVLKNYGWQDNQGIDLVNFSVDSNDPAIASILQKHGIQTKD